MTKQNKRFINKLLPAAVALFLVGCAATTPTQPDTQNHSPGERAVAGAQEEFDSITAARENAVNQSDVLEQLNEELDNSGEDILADSLETDIDIAQPAADSPTAKDEELTQTDNPESDAAESDITTADSDSDLALTHPDIWQRLRNGFSLPDRDNPRVLSSKQWYARNQAYLDRTFDRAKPYFYHIVEQVETRGMPLELALLPVVESAYQPFAYSHGRASGIWQFIPGTARRFGLKIDWWYDGRRDIDAATTAALDYLESLNKRFDGDWLLALAAYNSGEGTVARAVRYNKRRGRGTTFWDLKLPRETEGYVPKLLAIATIVAAPQENGIVLKPIENAPYVAEVNIGSQIDLAIAAKMAGISLEELYTLNPAFNRWATSPDGPHHLWLPRDKVEGFREKLAQLPRDERVRWVRHEIREGENLGQIAVNFKTTVGTIKRVNKIRGNMIRAGHYLLIPTSSKSQSHYALSETQRLRSTQNTRRSGTKIVHEVRSGDTLWDLSMAYKVSVRDLAAWNGMAPRDTLHLGQKLVIWSKHRAASDNNIAAVLPQGNPLAASLTRKINYRVRNGDSLARISQRFNVSVTKLKQWNPGARGKYIQPGQRLVVYVDVTKVAENI
jgi:membrane-bound lytic murein transglycosylase D